LAATQAFCELYGFSINPAQTVYVAHTAETQFIGRPNKVSTCYTSLMAHAGAVFTIDLRSLDYRHLRMNAPDLHFYLIDSMVPPTGAVEELLDREKAYQELRAHLKPVIGKRDVRDLRVRELKELVAHLPERLRGICSHIVSEEERHHLGSDCIESTQTSALGRLLTRSHDSLREQLLFSCPELDWLSKHAVTVEGCLGLRLTGRGMGACAVLLAQGQPEQIEARLKPWLAEYERIFGFQAKLRRVVVSAGGHSDTRLVNSGPALTGTFVETA
jgi:galactokinase